MSDIKVGDIVIERREEWRQPVEYIPRRVIKVGRRYLYLDFEQQGWRNDTQYCIETGLEKTRGYSSNTRVFRTYDDLRTHLISVIATPELLKKGLRLSYPFSATNNEEVLLELCKVVGCYEVTVKKIQDILDNVRERMLELEHQANEVSL